MRVFPMCFYRTDGIRSELWYARQA